MFNIDLDRTELAKFIDDVRADAAGTGPFLSVVELSITEPPH